MERKKAIKQLKYLEKLVPKDMRLAAEWDEDWKILMATIMSSQSRDETTIKIAEELFKKYNTLKKIAYAEYNNILKILKSLNYNKTKARHIKETAKILVEKYGEKIPKSIEELLELPGVGRKVANVYLVEAHNAAAIGVDTHVSRLAIKLEWTKNKNKHRIEKDLEMLFPKRYWNSINYILVRFGRSHKRKEEDKIIDKLTYKQF